ncbi:hypothetical protein DFQ28_005759 [Apophysomyces sp. BC1034]|nr:hypothetical protein DFQ28_005759 [Apophysomyces sp. BC1034]
MGTQLSKDSSSIDGRRRRKKALSALRHHQKHNQPIVASMSSSSGSSHSTKQNDSAVAGSSIQERTKAAANPVRHQVVMTDSIAPLSSLAAMAVPIGRPRALSNGAETTEAVPAVKEGSITSNITDDDGGTNFSSVCYASSVGSGTSTQTSPTSPCRTGHEGNSSIIFDSKLCSSSSSPPASTGKNKWVYDYGNEKEFDRLYLGLWALELAQTYPDCEVIGIDIVPPNDKASAHWINAVRASGDDQVTMANLTYEYGDILGPLKFKDNMFDFIYQRDVATVVPSKQWAALASEFYRVLQPGGALELAEHDLLFKRPGPVSSIINEWFQSAAGVIGIDPDYNSFMADILRTAGFVDIEERVYDIPLGEWPQDPLDRSHGFLNKEQIKTILRTIKRWWLTYIGVSSQEYDRVCMATLDEFEEYKTCTTWRIFIAKKPK